MTREEAERASGYAITHDWRYVPVGESAFFIVKGNEIHCWRDPAVSGQWITRSAIDAVTWPLLNEFGWVFTSVEHGNEQGQKFVRRLGFIESFRGPHRVFYVAKQMKHCKERELLS